MEILGLGATCVFLAWQWASIFLLVANGIRPGARERLQGSILGRIRYELMPVRYVLVVVIYVSDSMSSHNAFDYWRSGVLALNLWFCWFYRQKNDEDDDRWKKRRNRFASRVTEVGGRLEVVPVRSS